MMIRGVLLLLVVSISRPAVAEFTIGPKVGTLGFGLEGSLQLTERVGVRASYNAFDYDWDDELDGVSYAGDLALSSGLLLLDFRPGAGAFRLSAGIMLNGNEVDALADPANTYEAGDNIYTLAEVGELSATAEFDSVAPYVGFGFDLRRDAAVRFSFDAGVAFQGDPSVSIRTRGGTLSNDPLLLADLEQEARAFEEDLDSFELYPVLSFSISYVFR
ncbi:MAG: hypothetical protein AAGG11_05735 [Pseudomonadota bacterium]